MALTQDFFQTTVQARLARDPRFRSALYREAAQALLDGELPLCKSLLRDLVAAGIGLPGAAKRIGMSARSLARMLGPTANPSAETLAALLTTVGKEAGLRAEVRVARAVLTAA